MNASPTPASAFKPTPFFEHGEGIGAYGCVSVAAPIFLSEDDAFEIIKDEFAKLNLTVEKSGNKVTNIQIPYVYPSYDGDDKAKTHTGTLDFDFSIKGKNIDMEYVSSDDMFAWVNPEDGYNTAYSLNYKKAAKTLNDSLNDAKLKQAHGVFYDPAASIDIDIDSIENIDDETWEKNMEEAGAKSREEAVNALREQTKDFLAWLSAQGII